ncbi:MAG: hypothetical protein EBS89_09735, partial [Proteobacteria bacterium]|nr:hypothetical protein [Pseudomonadota bacterium]
MGRRLRGFGPLRLGYGASSQMAKLPPLGRPIRADGNEIGDSMRSEFDLEDRCDWVPHPERDRAGATAHEA